LETKSKVTKVISNQRVVFFELNNNPKKLFGFGNQQVAMVGGISYVIVQLESKTLSANERVFTALSEDYARQIYTDLKDYTQHYVTK
jgi:hypothetical protein|tara:strand:- start:33827 stop:34087 length:261 start_codon:yes stop_codon:yes gene_type:complete